MGFKEIFLLTYRMEENLKMEKEESLEEKTTRLFQEVMEGLEDLSKVVSEMREAAEKL